MNKEFALKWLLVPLSLAPTALFAYMGQFSRLMRDDYGNVAVARGSDPFAHALEMRSRWNGAFADFFLHGLLAPLDWEVARILPAFIIVLWLFGMIWLLKNILKQLNVEQHLIAIAIALASLILCATINGFYTLESLLVYFASTRYSLPLALLAVCIAAVSAAMLRSHTRRGVYLTAFWAGILCFLVAALSEMYLVFQLLVLASLLAASFILANRAHRRWILPVIMACCLATALCALVQLTAPGLVRRVDWFVGGGVTTPIRTLPDLIPFVLDRTLLYVANQYTFAGFALLFASGFLLALSLRKPRQRSVSSRSITLPAPPLWIGLVVQLCFVPILWLHTSDSLQVFGRFSYAFMVVICVNVVAIFAFILLLWQRKRLSVYITASPHRPLHLSSILMLIVLALLCLTQIRSIDYKAAGHLYITTIALLGCLTWMNATTAPTAEARWGGAMIILCFATVVIVAFVMLGVATYSIGNIRDRAMAPLSWVQVSTGLIWGACLGYWLGRNIELSGASSAWVTWYKMVSMLVIATICVGILFGRLQWIPDLRVYAREWDARHQYILTMRDSGLTSVEVAPLKYDLSRYFWNADMSTGPENRLAANYYGVESILQDEV